MIKTKHRYKKVMHIWAASLLISCMLTACGGNQKEDKSSEIHYKKVDSEFEMSEGRGLGICSAPSYYVRDESLYFISSDRADSFSESGIYLNRCSLSNGKVEETVRLGKEYTETEDGIIYDRILAMHVNDDKTIDAVLERKVTDSMGTTGEYSLKRVVFDKEGHETESVDFNMENTEPLDVWSCIIDDNDNAYVQVVDENNKSELGKYDSEGKCLFKTPIKNQINDFTLKLTSDNRPVISYNNLDDDNAKTEIIYIDENTGSELEKVDIQYEDQNVSGFNQKIINGYGEDTFYISHNDMLYAYHENTKTTDKILSWLECGFAGESVLYMTKCEDGRIFVLYSNCDYVGSSDDVSGYFLEQSTEENDDRTVIKVVSTYAMPMLDKCIIEQNESNPDYKIEYTCYDEINNEGSLDYDIMAGNIPDVYIMGYSDINKYIAKNAFEDLTPYIKNDDMVNEDYFLDGFLDAIKMNGKQYFLSDCFNISTLIGKKSELSKYEGSWTMDSFIEYCESKPDDVMPFYETTKQNLFYILGVNNFSRYIDWETGQCSFDGEEFRNLLEFCNRYEHKADGYLDGDLDCDKHAGPIRRGEVLFEYGTLIDITAAQAFAEEFGKDEIYIGFPTDDNSGIRLKCPYEFCLSSVSEHKEEGWDFIKQLMKNSEGSESRLDSSIKGFEQSFEAASASDGYGSYNGIAVTPAKKKDAETIKQLLKKSKYGYFIYGQFEIISEDVEKYFAGKRDIDETVRIIQDRMSKYVNENR